MSSSQWTRFSVSAGIQEAASAHGCSQGWSVTSVDEGIPTPVPDKSFHVFLPGKCHSLGSHFHPSPLKSQISQTTKQSKVRLGTRDTWQGMPTLDITWTHRPAGLVQFAAQPGQYLKKNKDHTPGQQPKNSQRIHKSDTRGDFLDTAYWTTLLAALSSRI